MILTQMNGARFYLEECYIDGDKKRLFYRIAGGKRLLSLELDYVKRIEVI